MAAFDTTEGLRAVLCLFEGVATGAADGYGRMGEKSALTLVHLGSGFANGIANLHNALSTSVPQRHINACFGKVCTRNESVQSLDLEIDVGGIFANQ